MTEGGFDYSIRRYIPIGEDLAQQLAINDQDMFVSRGNGSLHLVGRSVLAQNPPETIVFPDTMIRVRMIAIGLLRRWINTIWASRFMRQQIESKARTTAGIYKISQADVESFVVPLPPTKEQEHLLLEIAERIMSIDNVQVTTNLAMIRATRLRQSILKQAFEGKLVPQDPNDEPAHVLLERMRQTGQNNESVDKPARTRASRTGVRATKAPVKKARP
jgi:type I restriction enzyme S subunit